MAAISDSGAPLPFGSTVRIDGKGRGTITAVSYRDNQVRYNVHIEGSAYHVELPPSRLSVIPATVTVATAASASTDEKQTTETDLAPQDSSQSTTDGQNNNKENHSDSTASRFISVADDDIECLITHQTNKNTLSKTYYDLKLLNSFLSSISETRKIYEIPPPELCKILCKFFIAVRKPDGSNYEPSTLRGYLSSFDRQLRRHNYGHSLISDLQFSQLREVLKSKQKELKKDGKGNQPNKTDPISDEEIETFWNCEQLGAGTPDSIINTLWFYNTVHFGLRGAHEHRAMCWGDVQVKTDTDGNEFLEFNERQTKTRPGDNPRDVRAVKPKMWANLENSSRCPVQIYKNYAEKRPADYCNPDSPFYIATTTKPGQLHEWDQWFKRQPIGTGKLTSIVKRMVAASGIQTDKKLSNHSARKHLVQKLNDSGVPANQIMQISGHRNIQSVNNYSHLNHQQHRQISQILSRPATPPAHDVSQRHVNRPALQALAANFESTRAHVAPTSSSTLQSQSQTNAVIHIHGGIQSLFGGSMYGGSVDVHIHQSKAEPRGESSHD